MVPGGYSLPSEEVSTQSVNSFKNRLDHHWSAHPMKYNPNATHHLNLIACAPSRKTCLLQDIKTHFSHLLTGHNMIGWLAASIRKW